MLRGAELARAVMDAPNRYAVLSLGSAVPIAVGTDGFLNLQDEEIRKVYMKMSVQLHPDRLPGFPGATQAFQALVRAYELCCKPDLRADDSEDSRSEGEDSSDDEAAGGSDEEAEDEDEDEDDEDLRLSSSSSEEEEEDDDDSDDEGTTPRSKKAIVSLVAPVAVTASM